MSADLALAADPSIVERAADPATFIIESCERAKAWLAGVLEHGDIDTIVEIKSQAEAIRVYTMSKQLGKDAQLSATEIVRRAERGIGVAIRKGQAAGDIRTRRDGGPRPHENLPGGSRKVSKPGPTDFATEDELYGNGAGIYQLTDNVSEQEFEAALAEAKAEQNLSRANVVRKARGARARSRVRDGEDWIPEAGDNHGPAPAQRRRLITKWGAEGYTSRQIAERLGVADKVVRRIANESAIAIPADAALGKTRHHDSNRIVRETVHALEGLAMGVGLVSAEDIDPAEAANWAASLTDSIRVLNRLIKTMKEIAQ